MELLIYRADTIFMIMTEDKEMEHEIIRYMHNAMSINSIEAFGNIRGGLSQNCRTVYFVRALGINAGYKEDILKLDRTMLQGMREGRTAYKRINALAAVSSAQETDYYAGCFQKWSDSQRKCAETRTTDQNTGLSEALGRALAETLEKYRLVKPGMSATIEKNFAVKLMYWFDSVMKDLCAGMHWDEKSSIKLAVHNITKEQEYLFCYMLTLVGADVILLQSKSDVTLSAPLKELSSELMLGSYGDVEIPDFSPTLFEEERQPVNVVNTLHQPAESGNRGDAGKIRMVIPERPGRRQTSASNAPVLPTPVPVQMPQHASRNATQHTPATEKSFEQLALLASSVVMITIHDNTGKPIGSGSGIMIGRKGYILTNSHVACGGKFYTVKIEDDENSYRTEEIIKYNQVLDLAIIRIDRTLNPLPVYKGTQKLVRGQKVVAIGSPLGLFNSVSDGIISGFRSIDHVDMIQFTAPISHGSSGGAVLNMYGEVIGISTAGIDDGQNINLAVGYEFINMFIKGFV